MGTTLSLRPQKIGNMKKILLSAITVASFCMNAIAQEGTVLLYGNVGYNSNNPAVGETENTFTINPGIGYQFNENWTVGANLGIESQKDGEFKSSAFSAGPFVRYTESLSNTFAIYMQLQGGVLSNKFENPGQADFKTNGFNAGLFPAVFVNVNKNFGLNFSFGGINYTSVKVDGASKSSSIFDINFGQSFNIGVSKNFGGKK